MEHVESAVRIHPPCHRCDALAAPWRRAVAPDRRLRLGSRQRDGRADRYGRGERDRRGGHIGGHAHRYADSGTDIHAGTDTRPSRHAQAHAGTDTRPSRHAQAHAGTDTRPSRHAQAHADASTRTGDRAVHGSAVEPLDYALGE
jgi:hypothetical protein